jgi:hypothetical protein
MYDDIKQAHIDAESYQYQRISQIVEWDATTIEKPENFMCVQGIESIRLHNLKLKQYPEMAVISRYSQMQNRVRVMWEEVV